MKYLKIKDVLLNNNLEKVPVGTNPYIEIGDIDVYNKTYQYKDKKSVSGAKYALKNSIIVSTVRPTRGAIAIIQEDKIAVSNAFAIISVDEKQCYYKYLFYMINNNRFYDYLGSNSKGATYPTCSREDVYNYEIALPSLEEQEKIVKIFDIIFNNIDTKNKQINALNQLTKSQFIEMFGDPNINNKNFKKEQLSKQCSVVTGNTPPRKNLDFYGNYVEWIKSDNISENRIYLTTAKEYLSEKGLKVGKSVNEGSILMTCIAGSLNSIGNVAITDRKVSFNQQINGIITNSNNVYFMYEQFVLSKDYLHSPVNKASKGILSKNSLERLEFIFPPIEEQNKFGKIFQQIDKQKFEFEKQLEKLKELQESLMKEYFG